MLTERLEGGRGRNVDFRQTEPAKIRHRRLLCFSSEAARLRGSYMTQPRPPCGWPGFRVASVFDGLDQCKVVLIVFRPGRGRGWGGGEDSVLILKIDKGRVNDRSECVPVTRGDKRVIGG